jgi:hypothetical protein
MDALSQSINPCPSELGHHPVLGRGQKAVNKPDTLHAVVMHRGHLPRSSRGHDHLTHLHVLDRLHPIGHQDLSATINARINEIVVC